jgi:hypothetical protein
MIEVPMLIFTNSNDNYPIRGLDDNIPKVCYRPGLKAGWTYVVIRVFRCIFVSFVNYLFI